jgi:hypothetical protein
MFRKTNKTTINKNKNDKFHGLFVIFSFICFGIVRIYFN